MTPQTFATGDGWGIPGDELDQVDDEPGDEPGGELDLEE